MTLTDHGKKILIEKIRGGDSDSFNEMYSHYFTNVYSFSYKFLKSKELAQECTQITFIKVWERRDQLNSDLNFKSYLFTICKNCILKTIEKAARENKLKEMVLREIRTDREENSNTSDLEKVAQQALEQLPPQRQIIFKLCKIEGQSYKQVALNLGISDGTVRDHMFKAIKAIRRYLLLHRILMGLLCYYCLLL
jgi:RNA polymerase sigma-70 factor (family 1)